MTYREMAVKAEELIPNAMSNIFYLVDWNNGYIGGYDNKFNQMFNTDKKSIIDDLKMYKIDTVKIISPDELNKLRGYKKPSLEEYFAGLTS